MINELIRLSDKASVVLFGKAYALFPCCRRTSFHKLNNHILFIPYAMPPSTNTIY